MLRVPMFASRTNWALTANRLAVETEERRRRGLAIADLTESNPTRCGFDFDFQRIAGALADPRLLTYQPDARGPLEARQAVAGYYLERGDDVDPQQIFLTASTSEAYSYVFRLLAEPGDNALAPAPSYPLFDFLARLNDLEVVSYPLVYGAGWRIDLESLRARLNPRARAIIVVHPNNPTGSFVRRAELDFLLECAKPCGWALVADEVFADYTLAPAASGEPRVESFAGTSQVLTFTLSGLSKISAFPQMKASWVVVSGPAAERAAALERLEVIADTYLSLSAPVALALPRLLEARHSVQRQILARLGRNLEWLDAQLALDSPVSRLRVEGGWYVILRLPATRTDEEWALEFLREDGVLVHPGHFYDFPSEGHLIVSLLPPPEVFEDGVSKVLARAGRRSA